MQDIVAYSVPEIASLGHILNELDVPCLSPSCVIEMTRVVNKLKEIAAEAEDMEEGEKMVLNGLIIRLQDIIGIAVYQQKRVIDQFEAFLKQASEEES